MNIMNNVRKPKSAETDAMPMTAGTTEEFKAIVMMANRVAREFNDGAVWRE
jgi:hypothetical protein